MFNTKITKQIVSKIVAAIAVFGLFVMYVPAFAANVTFNTSSADCATVRVRNVTQNIPVNGVGPAGCDSLSAWTTGSVVANPGDLISVSIYYHNTGSDDAVGTRVRVTSPQNMSASTSHTIVGVVSASNGGYASGSVTVNLSESQTLQFVSNSQVSGSTIWNDNANGGPYTVFSDTNLFGQGVLANGNGIVSPGWSDQGAIRLQFRVGSESSVDRPDVTTQHTSSEDLTDVTLHGTIDNHNIGSLVWFELYDEDMNFIDQTNQIPVNAGNAIQSFSDEVDGPFNQGEVYSYRACGMFFNTPNTYQDCGSYETFVIGQTPSNDEPVANTQNADEVDEDSAELNGTVDMNDYNNGIVFFVYGQNQNDISDVELDYDRYSQANANEVNDQFEVVLVDNDHDGNSSFTYDVNNLESDEDYYYQICVEYDETNGNETLECGGVRSFTTNDEGNNDNLDVQTFVPEDVDNNSATLRGNVDEIGDESVFRFFEWGTNTAMTEELVISGSTGSTGEFSRTLHGLNEDTTYYYRACAEEVNSGHTDCGVRRSFRTDGDDVDESDITAITTEASSVGRTSAVLNGIAISTDVDIDTMWFEWGTSTGLNNQTSQTSINASGTRSLARSISGLSANTIYYYRVVAEDDNGDTAYGTIKFFRTSSNPVVIINPEPEQPEIEIVNGAGSLFLALDIEPDFENVVVGDNIDYTVKYRNISDVELEDVVIQVEFAEETRFIKSTAGFYSQPDHNLTVVVGDLDVDEEGMFVVRVEVLRGAAGDLIVAQANAGHDHPTLIDAQVGTVPAYALNNVVNDPNRLVGLALFGGAFFPTTFLGWLVLLLVIVLLVLLARKLYTDYDERNQGNINIQ